MSLSLFLYFRLFAALIARPLSRGQGAPSRTSTFQVRQGNKLHGEMIKNEEDVSPLSTPAKLKPHRRSSGGLPNWQSRIHHPLQESVERSCQRLNITSLVTRRGDRQSPTMDRILSQATRDFRKEKQGSWGRASGKLCRGRLLG